MNKKGSRRALVVALGVSMALHAALLAGGAMFVSLEAGEPLPAYEATLTSVPLAAAPPAPIPLLPLGATALLPGLPDASEEPALADPPVLLPALAEAAPEPPPVVALASPVAPRPPAEVAAFRDDALPGELRIRYALNASFADGEAEYTWRRDGDRYEIAGSARASGFFAVLLEGSLEQRATGRVTPDGLRPDQFLEWRPGAPPEGLTFDWTSRTVTQTRGGQERTSPMEGNTIDWLSLVFQLAHQPPLEGSTELRVYTQRRLYAYRLDVVGEEELDLPFGRVRTLHVRHGTAGQPDAVDVWLGIEQHYLPLRLRYPVARNRFMIEQTARALSTR